MRVECKLWSLTPWLCYIIFYFHFLKFHYRKNDFVWLILVGIFVYWGYIWEALSLSIQNPNHPVRAPGWFWTNTKLSEKVTFDIWFMSLWWSLVGDIQIWKIPNTRITRKKYLPASYFSVDCGKRMPRERYRPIIFEIQSMIVPTESSSVRTT